MTALDFTKDFLASRLVAIGCAVAAASVVAAFSAASASAAPGDVYFRGDGSGACWPKVTATPSVNVALFMRSPGVTVYGTATTNHVRVWYRIVDDYGRAQSQWGDLGLKPATASVPATYGTNEVTRGQLNQWSRFQYFVAWYSISGQTGTFNPVRTSYVTLSSYRVFGIDMYNSTLSFQGFMSACFG